MENGEKNDDWYDDPTYVMLYGRIREWKMENGKWKIMKDNAIADKSFSFAVRIVKLYKYMCYEKNEYVMSKQLLEAEQA